MTILVNHLYVSTGCQHGRHDYCALTEGAAGEKRPAKCKFCPALCLCPCHDKEPVGE